MKSVAQRIAEAPIEVREPKTPLPTSGEAWKELQPLPPALPEAPAMPEVTLEVNPGTLERERLPGFREAGCHWGPLARTNPAGAAPGPTDEQLVAARSHGRFVAECTARWLAGAG